MYSHGRLPGGYECPRLDREKCVLDGGGMKERERGTTDPALPSFMEYTSDEVRASFCMLRPYSSSMDARFRRNMDASWIEQIRDDGCVVKGRDVRGKRPCSA